MVNLQQIKYKIHMLKYTVFKSTDYAMLKISENFCFTVNINSVRINS
jgi:hypothetical protein